MKERLVPHDFALEASYAHCRDVARRAGSNFYTSSFLLPRQKRWSTWALYAFLRRTDDLTDAEPNSDVDDEHRQKALAAWRASLQRALIGDFDHLLLPALKDTVDRYRIPSEYLTAAIDGMEMDTGPCRYATFDELRLYCYRVASVVGLSCVHIWGFSDRAALDLAANCGIAFQLTNILRDLKEDAHRDRIYIPQEDLERFGYSIEDLRAGIADDRFRRMMDFEIRRAERFYGSVAPLVTHLHKDGGRVLRALAATYHRLLCEVRRAGDDVLRRRVRIGKMRRVWIAANAVFSRRLPDAMGKSQR